MSEHKHLNSKFDTYLVGGAVRDKLLSVPIKEYDYVVVGATAAQMLSKGFKQVGKDFPVFLHPETKEEYALARTERKKGRGYYGFECHASPEVTLEQDLQRRDLTINAMAESIATGELIDPYGGKLDLENKILRHVSPAFIEDPLRILRVARFAARLFPLGFTIASETSQLMKDMVAGGEVEELVPERVWQEMQRALIEADPKQFFLVLRECGALEKLWPALNKLWGVPQRPEYHPEIDTGVHTMMTLDQAAKISLDPLIRFAAICHDLGKGETPSADWPSHKGHEELGVPLVEGFAAQYRIPKTYRDLSKLVCRYHLHCHRFEELSHKTILKTLINLDAFRKPKRFEQFLIVCEADAKGRTGLENRLYPQAQLFRQAFELARSVDIREFVEQDLESEIIKEKIHRARLRAIEEGLPKNKNTPAEE